jgi:two-component system sensor histidine kinase HydH
MNRRLFLRVAAPSILGGSLLLAASGVSMWTSYLLQENLVSILSENVTSLKASQELEIHVRQLRFHNLLYLLEPKLDHLKRIALDEGLFANALEELRQTTLSKEEADIFQAIETAFLEYKSEQADLRKEAKAMTIGQLRQIVDSHPVRQVVEPCKELFRINQERMEQTARESRQVSQASFTAMLVLGVAGPLPGLIAGYGLTRGLRRSIYRLSVHVQDIAQHLDRDLGSVSVVADGDLHSLEEQVRVIVQKVQQAAQLLQNQQRELLRTEQMSQVGQLAAGVAHEIRNPLTGIKMLVEAAVRPNQPRPLGAEDLRVIHREVQRLEQTVQTFLDFARLPAPERRALDLREAVDRACALVQMRATQQNVVIERGEPGAPVVGDVDAGQMNTVLVNLLLNALDAMPQGGRILVELLPASQGWIQLRVSDTGSGIAPAAFDRLFQPFSTTKAHGTGMGLSLSRRILEEHHGTIHAYNREEGGACFVLKLPIHGDTP